MKVTYRRDGLKRIVRTTEHMNEVIGFLRKAPSYSFDTETEENGSLVGMSLYTPEMGSVFIPMGFDTSDYGLYNKNGNKFLKQTFDERQLGFGTVLDMIQPIFDDKEKLCIGHNIKFDMHVVRRRGAIIRNQLCDTMVMAWLLDENYFVSLKLRVRRDLHYRMKEFSDIVGKGAKKEKIIDLTIPFVAKYARDDAEWTYKLYEKYNPEIEKAGLSEVFWDVMMPTLKVLYKMERRGVSIDKNQLDVLDNKYSDEIAKLQQKIYSQVGSGFNLNSTKQMRDVLFGKFKLAPIKMTSGGKKGIPVPSTDEETLMALSKGSPFCADIIEHRGLTKLKGTYIDGIRNRLKNGKIYTSFNQTRTVTGRLSSSDPNLQNIPIRVERGKEIRNIFVASPGRKLLVFDEKNIELRLIAHFSKDRRMIKAFNEGKDLHLITAMNIFKVPADKVTRKQRDIAKAVNFGISYGEGPRALSEQLEIDFDTACEYMDNFFSTYPSVKPWIEGIKRRAHTNTYVRTLLGRYRRVPDINTPIVGDQEAQSKAFGIRSRNERQAVNAVIQGTAMDIIALAMIKLSPQLDERCKMIIQVHDELVFDCKEKWVDKFIPIIKNQMENPFARGYQLRVPIETDVAVVDRWGEAK